MRAKKNNNIWLIPVLILLIGGIVFSGWKLYDIYSGYRAATVEYRATSEEFVVRHDEPSSPVSPTFAPVTPAPDSIPELEAPTGPVFEGDFIHVDLEPGFSVEFERMWQTNRDVAAWISSPGTVIDYPVMRGKTNDTYLYNNWKGAYSTSGSIFANYQCKGDLSDYSTIIYGHNMKNGAMFHSLKSYKDQSYYEEHPYLWYLTPTGNYLLYVVGGCVVKSNDTAYSLLYSESEVRTLLELTRQRSDFRANYMIGDLTPDDIVENARRAVVLSTCSYEFDDARYIVVAVPILTN